MTVRQVVDQAALDWQAVAAVVGRQPLGSLVNDDNQLVPMAVVVHGDGDEACYLLV